MAIALDNGNNGTSGTTTSLTYSHTCTGSNLLLVVASAINSTSDLVTSVTYNGVAMTRKWGQGIDASARFGYGYYLINPATGANNVTVNLSGSVSVGACSCSWTGVKQSAFPDNSTTNAWTGTSTTDSITSIADNCWGFVIDGGDRAPTAGSGDVQRAAAPGFNCKIFDSNGPKTPAGAINMGLTRAAGGTNTSFIASFAPFVAAATNPASGFFALTQRT